MSRPTDFFNYRNGTLTVDGLPLERIAEKIGTPVYVYSADAMLAPLKKLQKGLAPLGRDNLMVCFAVKSNSNVAVLKLLGQAGAGMDLVSGGELFRARKAGVPSKRIVFSGVGKTPEEMAMALEQGIFSFNVESVPELLVLNDVSLHMKKRAPVAFRFNPDVNAKTHPYISTGLKKNKFGMNRAEILSIVARIRELPGIDLRGISCHIGSQLLSLSPLGDAFGRLRSLIEEINSMVDKPLSFADVGGGVGISYDDENPPKIEDYCKLVLKHFGPRAGLKHPLKILLEPGRLIAGNSGVLVTEVLYRKDRKEKDFLVVDAAMNDLIRPSLYGSYHGIFPVKKTRAKSKNTDVVGPVCETGDYFARDRKIASDLNGGELLAILSAGAYGFTMSSNYNSRPRPAEVLVQGGKMKVIRERESFADLIRGEKA